MTSHALVGNVRTSKAGGVLLSIIRMRPLSQSSAKGFCALEGLTPTSKLGLDTGLQLSIALAMAVVYACVMLGGRCWRALCGRLHRRSPPARQSSGRGPVPSAALGAAREPLIAPTHPSAGYGAIRASSRTLEVEIGGSDSPPSQASGEGSPGAPVARAPSVGRMAVGPIPRKVKLVTAATNFLITAHTTLTVATLSMLHCVWVGGARHAAVRCSPTPRPPMKLCGHLSALLC
jgi:hypothetical protein